MQSSAPSPKWPRSTTCQKNKYEVLPKRAVLYMTMEPINKRFSGNRTCVEKILRFNGAIKVVYVEIRESGTFITENMVWRLEDAGIVIVYVEGLQDSILEVSMAGHEKQNN